MQEGAWEKKIIAVYRILLFFGSIFFLGMSGYSWVYQLNGYAIIFFFGSVLCARYFVYLLGKTQIDLTSESIEFRKHFLFQIGYIFLLVISALPAYFFFSFRDSLIWLPLLVFPISTIYFILSRPTRISIYPDRLIIKYPLTKKTFSREEIKEVELVSDDYTSRWKGQNIIHLINKDTITLAGFNTMPVLLHSYLDNWWIGDALEKSGNAA